MRFTFNSESPTIINLAHHCSSNKQTSFSGSLDFDFAYATEVSRLIDSLAFHNSIG